MSSKRKTFTVTMGQKFHEMLVKYSQGKGLKGQRPTKRLVIETFIEMGVRHNIFESNWTDKLLKAKENINAFASLDDACDGLAFGEDEKGKGIWSCVWFKEGRPPQIRILGRTDSLKDGRCRACGKTQEIARGFANYEARIKTLKSEVGKGVVVKLPSCIQGGALSSDGKKLFCRDPKRSFESRSVEKWCKVVRKGANCRSLRWTTLSIKGQFADPEK